MELFRHSIGLYLKSFSDETKQAYNILYLESTSWSNDSGIQQPIFKIFFSDKTMYVDFLYFESTSW